MKTLKYVREGGRGSLIATTIANPKGDKNQQRSENGEAISAMPVSTQPTSIDAELLPDDGERVENLPPEQPDVEPLKRENPDLQEIEENQPQEKPDVSPQEKPKPDTGVEIEPEPDTGVPGERSPRAVPAKDPIVEPGTNPMDEVSSLFI